MALDTTIGGASSDSYVTLDEFKTYIEAVYGDAVAILSKEDEAIEIRLRISALLMNTIPWRGAKASRDQRLEFPRWWRTSDEYEYVKEDEDYFINYSDITDNAPTVPSEVKNAQCEITYQVVDHIMSLDPLAFPEKEIKMFSLGGSLGIEFFGNGSSNTSLNKAKLSSMDIVFAYLGKWYKTFGGGVV